MVLRAFIGTVTCAVLLTGTESIAGTYQPGDFLRLDLSKAVLSPEPLGPEAHFEPVPIEARTDRPTVASRLPVDSDITAIVPHANLARRPHAARTAERPRGAARNRLAQRRGNPLDAQAMDTRIQTWPCRPGNGGICGWR
ncbi:hypothetical protein HL666_04295 [Bradyrhizobium sp. 83002]|uniref:hypothetical protein n=1 Tax=Bradyrhizobium aeschynomenes TaxID=2734909 RepID=UPI001554BCC9|nr:hypothetical protein [Bradyrhizobium aeschynomenes]NPU09974.1 hypothetical protein [Bradyrhizobium aeschynomenes]NPV23466.1 hypothetical protein [Bradyrhizobium aeschynomenes]